MNNQILTNHFMSKFEICMRKLVFIFILFLPSILQSQDISSILFSNYSVNYFGQLTDNGRKKDGIGIYKLPNGNLYAGDMKMNKIHGFGMMIIGENSEISHCNGAYAYVGEWENGKKSGKGTIYNGNGIAIYCGNFINDAPTDKYPNNEINIAKRFSYLNLKEELYIGEIENGEPNGYGFTLYEEGFIFLFPFKHGIEDGVGIGILPPNYWTTFKAKNERFFPISSSSEQAQRTENNKAIATRTRAELVQSLNNVLEAGVQLAETIGSASSNEGPTYTNGTEGSDVPSSNSSLQSQYMQWERRAIANYNSLTNLGTRVKKNGEDVGGTNGQSISGGNYVMQKKALREAQNEMKKIRTKAIRQGINIQQSRYETIEVTY